ncbi:MAG: hypothetical protein KGZ39_07615 [Simkania sp.]|nr:hypothetical protein [Simkania sp.]
MTWDRQQEELAATAIHEYEEGSLAQLLMFACEELFPKFIEAGSFKCALYVSSFLLGKCTQKKSADSLAVVTRC